MTLVLGPLLANGEVVDPFESMDKENTTENKRYSPIITREKKRRIAVTSNNNDITTQDNDEVEKENQNGQQDHTEQHKNNTKKPHNHEQEKPNALKSPRIPKSGSVCCTIHIELTKYTNLVEKHKKGAQIKKHGDDSDSDEECFARDLKDRKVLEALERASNIDVRERADQARINRSFFDRSRHPEWKEQQAAYQALCEADLFNPPPAPPGFNLAECTEMEPLYPVVQVPGFTLVSPYIPYNHAHSRQFYEQYKTGYIHLYEDHDAVAALVENGKGKVTPEKEVKIPFYKRVADVFNLAEWTPEEVNFFEELLHAQGPHFEEISRLMCGSKNPAQLRAFFTDKWAIAIDPGQENKRRSTCHLCFQPGTDAKTHKKGKARLDRLVVCGGCERAYHVTCLNPRPTAVEDPWYCSDDCVSMSMLQCQLCGNAENDEQMLLCDTCDRGYHMFCLKPPLTAVPEGDWNCPQCTQPVTSVANTTLPPSQSTSRDSDQLIVGCTHASFNFINLIRSSESPRIFKVPNTCFLELNPSNLFHAKSPAPTSTSKSAKIKVETPDKPVPTELPTTASPNEPIVKTESSESQAQSPSIPPPPPPPPPTPRMTTRSNNRLSQSPSMPTKSNTKLALTPIKIPPQSPSTPRQSPSGRESPALSLKSSTSSYSSQQEELSEDDEEESIHMENDPSKIASSALPHSLLALKYWGKEMCIECLLQTGLLPGDAVFNRRSFGRQIEPRLVVEEYQSIFAQPVVTRKVNYKSATLIKRFDAILAAVNIATQQVLDGKADSNNHAHVLPVTEPVSTPVDPTKSRKRSAGSPEDGPNKQARTEEPASTVAQLQAQDLTSGQWWVFTYNPRVREVANLRPQAQLEWQVRQHVDKIKAGDRVYVWVSGKCAGIYALGTVTRDPFSAAMHPGEPSSSVLDRTRVRIDDLLPFIVSKEILEEDIFMRTLNVLRLPAGHVNYSVTPRHTEKLAKMICSSQHLASTSSSTQSSSSLSPSNSPSLSLATKVPPRPPTPFSPKEDNPKPSEDPNSIPVQTKPSRASPHSHSPARSSSPSPAISPSQSPPLLLFTPTGDPSTKFVNAPTPSTPPSVTTFQSNGFHAVTKATILSPVQSPHTTPPALRNPLISPTTHPPSAAPPTPPLYQSPTSPTSFPFVLYNTSSAHHTPTHAHTTTATTTTRTCDVCKRTEPSVRLRCLGCKDWYHPTCTTTPTGTLSLLPWYCPPCTTLNQQGRSCTACANAGPKTATPQPLVVCDLCSKGYHSACVTTPLPAPIPRCWLCAACVPTPVESVNSKLSIGWHELRLECSRIMSGECEYACEIHHKAIVTHSKVPSKVYSKMHELTFNLTQLRQAVVAVAQNRYACWAKSLIQSLPSSSPAPPSSK